MGVPALFRWLSKKYPKIVSRVVEETPTKVRNSGGEIVEVPVRYEGQNPNGFEVDNLYLDMNGIVHPCTHPEGKPAPETEEDMMVEIFNYTERVVNMARPRKVLMMAIDGVAPRAKMNQQRSRRFRAAQEAADKEEERKEAIKLFEAMGHPVSEETKNQKSWDSNAITPGTPFMDLLSASLKYWVSYKLTNDPGWKDLKVIISDASVPGEGEHKIVDWIRRQRSYPDWDANTSHVIYGLDADLIMLSLATHEPYFRVLREDVFFQGSKDPQACRKCGETGHFSANCKGEKKMKDPNVVEKAKPVDPKPFIFLDVACLREYLAVELNLPNVPFPFDLELAIDDWIFMIFFVGNDFLPHLPSLEIREGAIDVLLKIWRAELPRMGGYLTNHGKVDLGRAQVILEGLAKSEDEIFQRRKEDEERQDNNAKRRRIEDHRRQDEAKAKREGTTVLNGQEFVAVTPAATARGGTLHPSLPQRPGFDLVPKEEAGDGAKAVTAAAAAAGAAPSPPGKKLNKAERAAEAIKQGREQGLAALQGSNEDIVKNRRAIRMANLSAAEKLKAELEGRSTVADGEKSGPETVVMQRTEDEEQVEMTREEAREVLEEQGEEGGVDEEIVPREIQPDSEDGEAEVDRPGSEPMEAEAEAETETEPPSRASRVDGTTEGDGDVEVIGETEMETERIEGKRGKKKGKRGKKRKYDEAEEDLTSSSESESEAPPDIEADQPVPKKKLKFNPDGTVEGYEDDVKLWEPGYRERYYRNKFGVELSDREFVDQITKHYMEGLCWVLEYYYQGVPAWDWYYPYHYAPFAQDFRDVDKMKIEFQPAVPFKPFAQLLGVFPAASRKHLPSPLQSLMIDEDSPILDFYPEDFDIDMNGKKMAWQGVALLPFIDQTRLLDALRSKEDHLTDDEKRRNTWGDNIMFISEGHALYDPFCQLYTLKAVTKPVPLDMRLSQGTNGAVLADPSCVPNSAFDSPLASIDECPDIENNASLSVRYYFPRQSHKHRSILLRGFRPPPPRLTESDKDWVRRGGGGGRNGPRNSNGHGHHQHQQRHTGGPGVARNGGNGGYGNGNSGYNSGTSTPRNGPGPGGPGGPGGPPRGGGGYPNPREMAGYGVHSAPPQSAYGYGAGAGVGSYGGGAYGGAGAGAGAGSYGGGGGGGYGGNPYAGNPYGGGGGGYGAAPSAAYGGYPPPRGPHGAPPNPYGGAPAGGHGGQGGYGGYGASARGAYGGNPYAAQPPRGHKRF